MMLTDIEPAIARVRAQPVVRELRARTYLETYPDILALASSGTLDKALFQKISLMTYGWMPRILRLDPEHIQCALHALRGANNATLAKRPQIVEAIASCLHSVVGASKMLHFVYPATFPIWDSRIERFRQVPDSDITDAGQYCSFVYEVHSIILEAGFGLFRREFLGAHRARLIGSGILPYEISDVRAVEAAALELAAA
jgi:hypothetical protein